MEGIDSVMELPINVVKKDVTVTANKVVFSLAMFSFKYSSPYLLCSVLPYNYHIQEGFTHNITSQSIEA